MIIDVIIDLNYALVIMQPMQAAHVLLQRPAPRDWHCEKQCIQPRIVEAFAYILPSRDNDPWCILFNIAEILEQLVTRFLSHTAGQHEDVFDVAFELLCECAQMIFSFS